MILRLFPILFLLFAFFMPAYSVDEPKREKDFYMLTIPKSGSFLLLKLLNMITNKRHVFPSIEFHNSLPPTVFPGDKPTARLPYKTLEKAMAQWKKEERFAAGHMNLADHYSRFSRKHPEYVRILQIRDLRDAIVSLLYYHWKEIKKEIGPTTAEQKIQFLIDLKDGKTNAPIHNIYRNAQKAVEWLNKPNVFVCRFEAIVGKNGGGSEGKQRKTIRALSRALNYPLTEERLNAIIEQLFGNTKGPKLSKTFRKGKIGEWKDHFTQAHCESFAKKWGHLQKALGYSIDFSE